MKRIGFSGTNWTGKSTVISRLRESLTSTDCEVVSLGELCARSPYPMFKDQTLDGSRWMIEQVHDILRRQPSVDLQIFDRTPIDILAFSSYVGYRDRSADALDVCKQAEDLIHEFDALFVMYTSVDWPQGEWHTPDEIGFALVIEHFMAKEVAERRLSCEILPWNINDRINVIIRTAKL